eukprot:TRINITY_DN10662_c0_g1_i1.p1 TRINITY_DN10662_c0_g1~~TRINITY_DN10662_c0_g1_i1.p1  ORF type:complete len:528 (-),score=116.41 TRINITY_DN10662_c0_g1_i1:295-1878(-)
MVDRRRPIALGLLLVLGLGTGQQIDPSGEEDTKQSGIRIEVNGKKDVPQFVVMDSKWRWLHNSKFKSCGSGAASTAMDMERCYLQGLNSAMYRDTYGIHVGMPNNRAVTLRYATKGKDAPDPNYGTRVYLTDGEGYTMFKPLGGEISFNVDVSKVPAGMNAAVYLVSMDRLGNLNTVNPSGVINTAGWKRGVGYCDAQCPKDMKFVQDQGFNNGDIASCCPEMDLFEANRFTTAMTPHPCKLSTASWCDSSKEANCKARCDSDGADVNPFREKGPGHALFDLLDVSQPFKVRTLFKTDNNMSSGSLVEIEQIFEQRLKDGSVKTFTMSLTDESAAKQKEIFKAVNGFGETYGGLKGMGEALRKGMVMVLAIWADPGGNMNWLDSCDANATVYSCADNALFSNATWEEAQKVAPGSWRGPADYYKDFATSFKTKPVTFSYSGIPAAFRTQAMFDCIGCLAPGAPCDCASNDYGFYVSDFVVTGQAQDTDSGGVNVWVWVGLAVGICVVIAGLCYCCYACSRDTAQLKV